MKWHIIDQSGLAFLSFMVKEKNISEKEIQDLQKLIDDYENSSK